jgi:putative ABC transport system permease protein
MLLWTIVKVGLMSLLANKTRSILAMLGIIIGVAAVIAMLALGTGAQRKVLDSIATMGTNLLVIQPTQRGSQGVTSGTQQNLTVEDAQAVLAEVGGIEQISPVVNRSCQVKYSNQNKRTSVIGCADAYLGIRNFQIDRGRGIRDIETERLARVAVLGPSTVEELFGVNDPIGETVKINGISFLVIGVTKAKGSQGWFNPDEVVFIPYTTAMKQMFGLTYVSEIDVQAKDGADSATVQADIIALMRKRHRTQEGAADDVNIRNQADIIATASGATGAFKALLGGVAAISLLVGGIGIMNIMLVSVTERTREIGIRKAIGAKERHILWQFLLESVIVSGLGGMIGLLLGLAASKIVPLFIPLPCVVEASSIFLALSFSPMVGIIFGVYPAWRAARLDPVDALRYE